MENISPPPRKRPKRTGTSSRFNSLLNSLLQTTANNHKKQNKLHIKAPKPSNITTHTKSGLRKSKISRPSIYKSQEYPDNSDQDSSVNSSSESTTIPSFYNRTQEYFQSAFCSKKLENSFETVHVQSDQRSYGVHFLDLDGFLHPSDDISPLEIPFLQPYQIIPFYFDTDSQKLKTSTPRLYLPMKISKSFQIQFNFFSIPNYFRHPDDPSSYPLTFDSDPNNISSLNLLGIFNYVSTTTGKKSLSDIPFHVVPRPCWNIIRPLSKTSIIQSRRSKRTNRYIYKNIPPHCDNQLGYICFTIQFGSLSK